MRLDVKKTYKLYIGGQFARSESGKVLAAHGPGGDLLDNHSYASRKDFRDAAVAARTAFGGWAKKTAYNRGQILYRAAEMLEQRRDEMARELARSGGGTVAKAAAEVDASIDRLVYWAGWTDKFTQVFGAVNPVATPHFNFTTPEPTGVVVAVAPEEPALLGLVSVIAPAICAGNTVIALTSESRPLPGLVFGEVLATSDLPGGVVNILSGKRAELAPWIAGHLDINAVVDASGDAAIGTVLQGGAAQNLKRYAARPLSAKAWSTEAAKDAYWLLDGLEMKTAWHPIGV